MGFDKKGKKRQRLNPESKREDSGAGGVAKTKRLIRGVERLLRKETLAAEIRAAQEIKLKQLQYQLEQQSSALQLKELEIKMSAKYKKIRFFEKQKITRKLDQVARKEAEGDGDRDQLAAEREAAQRDLFYLANYPRSEAYISLFLPADKDTEEVQQKREAMRHRIEEMHAKKQQSTHAVDLEQEQENRPGSEDADDDFFVQAEQEEEEEEEEPAAESKASAKKPKKKKKRTA
eukprot:TRINITY_DN7947_c0_g1_i1.p1 TRINITY_DN7947_c0_g1~~TRINITY_DN7947_c0_g1_i1.p1  ORF type:complete len:233 (+),score=97.84 TRINITY_DN7947_c0_g1_i1:115-813(+)